MTTSLVNTARLEITGASPAINKLHNGEKCQRRLESIHGRRFGFGWCEGTKGDMPGLKDPSLSEVNPPRRPRQALRLQAKYFIVAPVLEFGDDVAANFVSRLQHNAVYSLTVEIESQSAPTADKFGKRGGHRWVRLGEGQPTTVQMLENSEKEHEKHTLRKISTSSHFLLDVRQIEKPPQGCETLNLVR